MKTLSGSRVRAIPTCQEMEIKREQREGAWLEERKEGRRDGPTRTDRIGTQARIVGSRRSLGLWVLLGRLFLSFPHYQLLTSFLSPGN